MKPIYYQLCASAKMILPKMKMKERKPIPKTNVVAIMAISRIFISPSSLFHLIPFPEGDGGEKDNKKPVVNTDHG
jgi:hypothetical protein